MKTFDEELYQNILFYHYSSSKDVNIKFCLVEDIQKFCLDKQKVRKAIEKICNKYDDETSYLKKELLKELGL